MTAVSQDASVVSGFWLQYDGTTGKWAMSTRDSDSQSATLRQALSTGTATTGTWTHLVGVYDTGANQLRLYVNGTLQSTTTVSSVANATGALQVGRGMSNGGYASYWSGSIDQVRMYSHALADSDVAALYAGGEAAGTASAGQPGALGGTNATSTAVAFEGTVGGYNPWFVISPNTFSNECWFRVSGTAGGTLMAFSDQQTGSSTNTDRVIYLDSGGHLTFGVKPAGVYTTIRSPLAYNDSAWHQVFASLGSAGMKLYVDGALVASNPAVTTGAAYFGYSRLAGVSLSGWPNRPTSDYLIGTIDEVSVYLSQLSDSQVGVHYYARNR
jgi:hypothetical protein